MFAAYWSLTQMERIARRTLQWAVSLSVWDLETGNYNTNERQSLDYSSNSFFWKEPNALRSSLFRWKQQVSRSARLPCISGTLQMVVLKVGMRHRSHGEACVCLKQIHMLFLAFWGVWSMKQNWECRRQEQEQCRSLNWFWAQWERCTAN